MYLCIHTYMCALTHTNYAAKGKLCGIIFNSVIFIHLTLKQHFCEICKLCTKCGIIAGT